MSIEQLADTLLEKLKTISQAETVIGAPVQAGNATVIPVSKVSVGFVLGANKSKADTAGTGGGVSIEPLAFLVVNGDDVKLLPVKESNSAIGKVIDMVPEVIQSFKKDSAEG